MVQEAISEEIIPAILPESIEELREKLGQVARLVPIVQIDVCDGKLTPEATWPYNRHSQLSFEQILAGEDGLPFWDVVDFELDLMVEHPEDEVEKWIGAGASRIVVHYESTDPGTLRQILSDMKDRSVETGLAINAETSIDVVDDFVHLLDEVQLMGIEQIGFQGQPFYEKTLEKISELRERYPDLNISVDGGVNLETAPAILDAGANRLVVGSALFHNYDVEENLKSFEDLLYLE